MGTRRGEPHLSGGPAGGSAATRASHAASASRPRSCSPGQYRALPRSPRGSPPPCPALSSPAAFPARGHCPPLLSPPAHLSPRLALPPWPPHPTLAVQLRPKIEEVRLGSQATYRGPKLLGAPPSLPEEVIPCQAYREAPKTCGSLISGLSSPEGQLHWPGEWTWSWPDMRGNF